MSFRFIYIIFYFVDLFIIKHIAKKENIDIKEVKLQEVEIKSKIKFTKKIKSQTINKWFLVSYIINLSLLFVWIIPITIAIIVFIFMNSWKDFPFLIIALSIFIFIFTRYISSLLKICILTGNKNFYKKILILDILFLNIIDLIGIIIILKRNKSFINYAVNTKIEYDLIRKIINSYFKKILLFILFIISLLIIDYVIIFTLKINFITTFLGIINLIIFIWLFFILIPKFIFSFISLIICKKLLKNNDINLLLSLIRFISFTNIKNLLPLIITANISDSNNKQFLLEKIY